MIINLLSDKYFIAEVQESSKNIMSENRIKSEERIINDISQNQHQDTKSDEDK